MKDYQPIAKMSDKQLAQFRSKLLTEAIELGWKVHISLKVTHLFRAKVTSLNEVNLSA